MAFTDKLLDAIVGVLPTAVLALIPEHRKTQAVQRLQDLNPFATIADNHDLVRVLRVAWIEAAEEILKAGRTAVQSPDRTRAEQAQMEQFYGLAIGELRRIRDASFDRRAVPGITAIDPHLSAVMRGAVEITTPAAPSDGDDARTVTAGFTGTLAALVTGDDIGAVPPILVRIAREGVVQRDDGPRRVFGDLVFAAFAESLKDPKKHPQATAAFHMATQSVARALGEQTLAALRNLDGRLDAELVRLDAATLLTGEALRRIDDRTARMEAAQHEHGAKLDDQSAMLAELLAIAHGGGVFDRARADGIPEAAVRAIVERLGGKGVSRDDLVPWLDKWIEAARRELGRHSNEGEAFEAARQEAERRFRAGRLTEASAAFMEELAREEREESLRQEERRRRQMRLLEEAVRFDELAFDSEAAVAKFRKMAALDGATGPDAHGEWLFGKALEFYERGDVRGENGALLITIALYRAVLEAWTQQHTPLQWAMIQNNLGNALQTLGEREAGTGRLEEAVIAFRAALQEQTQQHTPLDWAITHNNLGSALLRLGEREAKTGQLVEAVTAFRAALEEFTQQHTPFQWAMTQNNLGNALFRLGEREAGTGRLEEAVTAYRAALEERTRQHAPHQWAMIQNNLGSVLRALGVQETGTRRLEEAVIAFRAALEERTRQHTPHQWAITQNNLGNALFTLGEREAGIRRLEEAVTAFRAALEEFTQQHTPFQWAMTQNNLGNALFRLGEREAGTGRLEEAVTAYNAALEERTRERTPLDWAMSLGNQGVALACLAERRGDAATARQALEQIEQAYGVFHDAGHASADYYAARLSSARELVAYLSNPAEH